MAESAKNTFLGIGREGRKYKNNLLITYDCITGKFQYPKNINEYFDGVYNNERPFWEIIFNSYVVDHKTGIEIMNAINDISKNGGVYFAEYIFKTKGVKSWYRVGFIHNDNIINITMTDITGEVIADVYNRNDRDDLTGLLNKESFCKRLMQY